MRCALSVILKIRGISNAEDLLAGVNGSGRVTTGRCGGFGFAEPLSG